MAGEEAKGRQLTPEEVREWTMHRLRQEAQSLDVPMEVARLKQLMRAAKDQFNQIKSQLGDLKRLRKEQEEQKTDIRDLEEKQEEVLECLEKIWATLEEYLAQERPTASQAAKDVAEKVLELEEQIGMIWDAVERLEKHLGLSD